LAKLSDEDAGEFFRQLLETLGDTFDTAEYDRIRRLVWEWQVRAYEDHEAVNFRYPDGPFAPAPSLSDATVALMSAGGVYVEGEDPTGGETQEQAVARIGEYLREPPTLVSIPRDVSPRDLRVRHPGYDVRGAERDINCVFPIRALNELARDGVIGEINRRHYSFVGAASQLRLRNEIAPSWGEKLRADGVDVCLLVAT
jgi:glycine/betaine/sarcosine/D-proline reductase family selenoprotein B